MDDLHAVESLLEGLGLRYGIADLQLDRNGAVGLELADGTMLNLEYLPDRRRLFAYTPVQVIPASHEDRYSLMELALHMNCLEAETVCGTLAIDRCGEFMLLQVGMDIEMLDLQQLDDTLQSLLAHRIRIEEMLKEVVRPVGPTRASSPASVSPVLAEWTFMT